MAAIPKQHRWVFWEMDVDTLDSQKSANYILARVLEFGGIDEVMWLIAEYGKERIHGFLRDVGQVEITERTKQFWRAVFHAEEEQWADPGSWRRSIGAPWPD